MTAFILVAAAAVAGIWAWCVRVLTKPDRPIVRSGEGIKPGNDKWHC